MAYSTNQLAKSAVDALLPVIQGLRVNDLAAYTSPNSVLGRQLRSDFIRDEKQILGALNNATNAAYDMNRAQAIEDAISAEDTNYANTRNAIAEMRRNLIGSGSSGANVGAANATALQALLGLGQSNAQTTTESLRAINNVSRQRASQLAENAVTAINTANEATAKMYDPATSAYGSDRSYAAQGAAGALGDLAAAIDTAASQERQTSDTNRTNERMNRYTADIGLKGTKYTADKTLEGTRYTADRDTESNRYVADQNLRGVIETALRGLEGTKYTADVNLQGVKDTNLKNLEGTKYSSDKNLEGTKYNADTNLKIENTTKKTESKNTNTNKNTSTETVTSTSTNKNHNYNYNKK